MISVINADAGWSILDSIDGRITNTKAVPKPRPALKRALILQDLAARGGKYATQRTIREAVGMAKSGFASALFIKMEADGVIMQGKPIKSGHGNMALTYRITQKGLEEVNGR